MFTLGVSTYFAPVKLADSGQVFRARTVDGETHFVSGGEYAVVSRTGEVRATDDGYFKNYFDLQTDYAEIEKTLNLPQDIIKAGRGIRILRASFIETVISFIISANNNIKRIKKTVERLCEQYGEKRSFGEITYFSFPSTEKLLTINVDNFRDLGCGYRAPYLVKAVLQLKSMDFNRLCGLTNNELYKQLIKLAGVGDKVARCIMLFAFHRLDIVPVDTWILKGAGAYVDIKNKSVRTVAESLQKFFGGYAGVAQQYIFDKDRIAL